jgi:hypothetical protein
MSRVATNILTACLVSAFTAATGCGSQSGQELETGSANESTASASREVPEGTEPPALITVMNACKQGPCTVRIMNEATKRCLTLDASQAFVTEACSENASSQLFVISKTTQGFWSTNLESIRHVSSGRCLTYAPGAPTAVECSSTNSLQGWYFMTGGHDEFVGLESLSGSSEYRGRSDFLLRDAAPSHRVTAAARQKTFETNLQWTFVSAK